MSNQYISSILAITSLAFSTALMAQAMSRSKYQAAYKAIESDYAFAKSSCASFADHARGICMAVAKSHEKIAKTQLDVRYLSVKESDCTKGVATSCREEVSSGRNDQPAVTPRCNGITKT